jgi:NAD(P)-dependent dehydrogenase (short-subunit alcohol dehydrogenase family)
MIDTPPMSRAVRSLDDVRALYDFTGRTAVVTGGTGVLGAAMARAVAACNASVVLLARNVARAQQLADELPAGGGGRHRAIAADVLDRPALEEACRRVLAEHGQVDILVNGAGGNDPRATTNAEAGFFDVPLAAWQAVTQLNLLGTILPSQVFARPMADRKQGVILNVSSVNASRPLTRIAGYSASKAGISNFTQWLAVHLAQEYSPAIRVNAIMPGFFLTEQNRFLLTDQVTGGLTARGQRILDHTPLGRFGAADDLTGAVLWLLSPASSFVTGAVVPVDGGFTAYAGV